MLEFNTFTSAYFGIASSVMQNGKNSSPRGMTQREIIGLTYCVEQLHIPYLIPIPGIERKPNYKYGNAFRDFVLSGADVMPQSLKELNPMSVKFDAESSNDFNEYDLPVDFSMFYGPRIHHQLQHIVEELRTDPDSRRAYISILDGMNDNTLLEDMASGKLKNIEYPCTIGCHFMIRNNKLHCTSQYRSQNMISVLPYDFLIVTSLQKHIAAELNIKVGKYISHISSAHIYEKDFGITLDMIDKYEENNIRLEIQ